MYGTYQVNLVLNLWKQNHRACPLWHYSYALV